MRALLLIALVGAGSGLVMTQSPSAPAADNRRATLVAMTLVGSTNLVPFGVPPLTPQAIERARLNGLRYTDRPSFGSGITWVRGDEFVGTTDRGPNDDRLEAVGRANALLFPLPDFTPTLVRFRWRGDRLTPLTYLPLRDTNGRGVSGLPNSDADDRGFESDRATTPLAFNPNGLDIEAIQRFRDGRFLLGDEYAPSLVVASADGRVLMRYTPRAWKLDGVTYPTRRLLPDALLNRRKNRGFESVALSSDGRAAYAILESPLGSTSAPEFADTRLVRAIKLDMSDPLNARVVGEYLIETSPVTDYPGTVRQSDLKLSDAAWVGPDRLLLIERAPTAVRVLLLDFSRATNMLDRPEAAGMSLEADRRPLAERGVVPVGRQVVFDSRDIPAIDEVKIEGLTILSRTDVVLMTDNDFGIGDNEAGVPAKIWRIRLAQPLPLAER